MAKRPMPGFSVYEMIETCIERLQQIQMGPNRCQENSEAIQALATAAEILAPEEDEDERTAESLAQ